MGSEMFYKNHCIPSVKTPRVRKPEDVYELRVPDPLKDGRLPIVLEGLAKLKERLDGRIVIVNPCGTGRPRFVISARFAPFPPSRPRISLDPSLNE